MLIGMDKFIITGGHQLTGETKISGAKNVALKALIAACLTDEKVVINNVPLISDVQVMVDIIRQLGGSVAIRDHTFIIQMKKFHSNKVSLDEAAQTRTASMFIAPLLARVGYAVIPNPGGCRIGARPIDRTIEGLKQMGAEIDYKSEDGFFHAKTQGSQSSEVLLRPLADQNDGLSKLKGITYRFEKNTHTGTETLIIAATLAQGKTILENAAQEPEIDELIAMLTTMGAKVKRTQPRTIAVEGVERLHGMTFTIGADRNEIVTFAIAAIATRGDVFVKGARREGLVEFLEALDNCGGGYEIQDDGIRFYFKDTLQPTDITTTPYPGFMTDWQQPWAVLMTQAHGISSIHETVFESRFGYVEELRKMGAKITMFNPKVADVDTVYNFNRSDETAGAFHAIKIFGPTKLHNAVVKISDLRAGATLVIAALLAEGESTVFGVDKLDRGYEQFDQRLLALGAKIRRVKNE